ncbi:hypothetical protein [Pseudoalteromonas phenolica]|uniref:hypothetical protein n=1 Tax=Pseudoalteromonas phenolica TaxID=161398 RepID=UPI001486D1E5|nr:hypothetical protein [Pseudoalteromonas phenolica]
MKTKLQSKVLPQGMHSVVAAGNGSGNDPIGTPIKTRSLPITKLGSSGGGIRTRIVIN